MTSEERIANMSIAIKQAMRVMGDRFGSTEQDVARTVQALKMSLEVASEPSPTLETLSPSAP